MPVPLNAITRPLARRGIKSRLTETIHSLPENFRVKPESAANELQRRGQVKPEEMEFSGMNDAIDVYKAEPGVTPITKQELVEIDAGREDYRVDMRSFNESSLDEMDDQLMFGDPARGYFEITLPDTSPDRYDMRITTNPRISEASDAHLTSEAWYDDSGRLVSREDEEVPGVNFWRRLDFLNLAGRDTLRVQELQAPIHSRPGVPASDFEINRKSFAHEELGAELSAFHYDHNEALRELERISDFGHLDPEDFAAHIKDEKLKLAARQNSIKEQNPNATVLPVADTVLAEALTAKTQREFTEILEDIRARYHTERVDRVRQYEEARTAFNKLKPALPHEKTWVRKALELSVLEAVDNWQSQVAVPIRGYGIEKLHRSAGVQQAVYEEQVPAQMKKIVKDLKGQGIDVEYTTFQQMAPGYTKVLPDDIDADAVRLAKATLKAPTASSLDKEQARHALQDKKARATFYVSFMASSKDALQLTSSPVEMLSHYGATLDEISLAAERYRTFKLQDTRNATTYAAIRLPKPGRRGENLPSPSFELYAKALPVTAATLMATTQSEDAMAALSPEVQQEIDAAFAHPDISPKDVMEQLTQYEGFSPAEASKAAKEYALRTKADLVNAGLSEEEAIQELINEGFSPLYFTPTSEPGEPASLDVEPVTTPGNLEVIKEAGVPDIQELVNKSDAMHFLPSDMWTMLKPIVSELYSTVPFIGFDFATKEDQISAMRYSLELTAKAQETLQRFGIEAELRDIDGSQGLYAKNPETGEWEEATSGWVEALLDGVVNARQEIGLGIMGSIIGSRGGPIGEKAGSAIGTALGRFEDLHRLSKELKMAEGINERVYARQMVEAGMLGVFGDVIIRSTVAPLVKFGGKYSMKALRGTMNQVLKLFPDNQNGAREVLLRELHVTEEEATDLMKRLAKLTGVPYKSTTQELIANLPQMLPGGQNIAATVNALDPGAGNAYAKAVRERAEAFDKLLTDADPQMVPIVLKDELDELIDTVQGGYRIIRDTGREEMRHTPYHFDMKKLAIEPMLNRVKGIIQNPAVLDQFKGILLKIEAASQTRDFGALLDLRQAISEFKTNKKILKAANKQEVDRVLKSIDAEIAHAANRHMKDGATWVHNYRATRLEVAKLNRMYDNIIFKQLIKPGIDPVAVVKKSYKHLSAQDGTFEEISAKLTPKLRHAYEKAMLSEAFDKFSLKQGQGAAAVDWVKFSAELETKGFRDPKVKEMKRLAREFAQVYQNDISLATATSGISIPRNQSYLTTNIVTRLHFEAASGIMGYLKRMRSTDVAKYSSLVVHATKFMKNPAQLKSMKALLEQVKEDPQLASQIEQLHFKWAEHGANQPQIGKGPLKVEVWGKENTKSTKGPITEGQRYMLDEKSSKKRFGEASVREISYHRIAKYQDIEDVLGTGWDIEDVRVNKKNVIQKLQDKGFQGINIGDEVVMFPSTGAPSAERGAYKPRKTGETPDTTYHQIYPELPSGDFTPPSSAKDMTNYTNWR